MEIPVMLTIRSEQRYGGQEPEVIELTTEGFLRSMGCDVWEIFYEESALTGLEGVCTTFHIQPGKVVLDRTGTLQSQMIFEENTRYDSLYQMDFGALMIGICARKIQVRIDEKGGFLDVNYDIQIEQNQAGTVLYHVDIKAK